MKQRFKNNLTFELDNNREPETLTRWIKDVSAYLLFAGSVLAISYAFVYANFN